MTTVPIKFVVSAMGCRLEPTPTDRVDAVWLVRRETNGPHGRPIESKERRCGHRSTEQGSWVKDESGYGRWCSVSTMRWYDRSTWYGVCISKVL
jgi:hypothetical protein